MTNDTKRGFCIFLACAIAGAVLLSLFYILEHKAFAFIDIGADTYTYYYPLQIEFARQLHNLHLFTWSFSAGLGNYIGWQSNILFLLDAIFPKTWQLGLRLPSYMLMLLLAGSFMFGYLRKLTFEPLLATAGAIAYTFCGYATINGQWDTQGYVLAQLVAYLFCFECYFRDRKALYAILAGLIVGTGNVFDTYTFTLFTLLYVIARPFLVPKCKDAAPYAPSLLRYIGWSALGAMLASIVLVPNIIYLLSSTRVSGTSSNFDKIISNAISLTNIHEFGAEISGILGKNIFGSGSDFSGISNWFEAPGFYVSVLLLTCVPQLLAPNATSKEKKLFISGLVLLTFYVICPLFRYAVYGFGHYGYRLSTLWVSLGILVLGIGGLRHIYYRGTWRVGLVLSTVFIIVLTLAVAFTYRKIVNIQHVTLLIVFAATYCVLLWPTSSGKPRATILIVIMVLSSELVLFSMPSFTNRHAVDIHAIASIDQKGADTAAVVDYLKKNQGSDEFFRIAKTYGQGFPNESMIMGYNGTTSYFLQGKSTARFFEYMSLQPRPISNIIKPIINRPKILDLLGVKYILTTDQKFTLGARGTYMGHRGNVKIFKNDDTNGGAGIYHSLISEKRANGLSVDARDDLLLKKVIVDSPSQIRAQISGLGARNRPQEKANESISLHKASDVHLVAHVSVAQSSVVLLAIPFNKGWSAALDSTEVHLFRADYGLTALLVPKGQHDIQLRYEAPGRIIGQWLSLTAAFLLATIYFLYVFIGRRKFYATP